MKIPTRQDQIKQGQNTQNQATGKWREWRTKSKERSLPFGSDFSGKHQGENNDNFTSDEPCGKLPDLNCQKASNADQPAFSGVQKLNSRNQLSPPAVSDSIPLGISEIQKLNNRDLLSRTKALTQKERAVHIQVLRHLREIESRKLYFSEGCSSLFDYAVRELGYSEGAASRRIKAMKLCRDLPPAEKKLQSGKLSLSGACQLQSFFERQKKAALSSQKKSLGTGSLSESKDPSQGDKPKQNKENLSSNSQVLLFPNSFSPAQNGLSSDSSADAQNGLSSDSPADPKNLSDSFLRREDSQKSSSAPSSSAPPAIQKNPGLWSRKQKLDLVKKAEGMSFREMERLLSDRAMEPAVQKERVRFLGEGKVEMKAVIDLGCYRKLEELKNLLSHRTPVMSNGELLGILSDLGLQKYDPRKKGMGRKNTARKNKPGQKSESARKILNRKKAKATMKISESQQARQDFPTPAPELEQQAKDFLTKASELNRARNKPPTPPPELEQQTKDSLTKASELNRARNKSPTPPPELEQQAKDSLTKASELNRARNKSPTPAPELKQKTPFAPRKRYRRYIPAKIKRLVWMRDQGQCVYKTRTGQKCGSRRFLQIDHIQPFALGGDSEPENLRLLCAGHNRFREVSANRFQKKQRSYTDPS